MQEIDLALQQEQKELLKQRQSLKKTNQRPLSESEYRQNKFQNVAFSCKKFIAGKMLTQDATQDYDSLVYLSMYRKTQPCPLRSTINQLRVIKAEKQQLEDSSRLFLGQSYQNLPVKKQDMKGVGINLMDDYLNLHKKEVLQENTKMEMKVARVMIKRIMEEIQQTNKQQKLRLSLEVEKAKQRPRSTLAKDRSQMRREPNFVQNVDQNFRLLTQSDYIDPAQVVEELHKSNLVVNKNKANSRQLSQTQASSSEVVYKNHSESFQPSQGNQTTKNLSGGRQTDKEKLFEISLSVRQFKQSLERRKIGKISKLISTLDRSFENIRNSENNLKEMFQPDFDRTFMNKQTIIATHLKSEDQVRKAALDLSKYYQRKNLRNQDIQLENMFASNQNKYIITKSDKTESKIVIKKKDLPSDKKICY